MQKWKKFTVAAAVVLASAGGGAAIAGQGPGAGDDTGAGSGAATSAVRDLGNGTTEGKYVPITPCRIVDTRVAGGQIASNVARSFKARGSSDFPAQGGKAGGCGIPASATAIEVAVTSVDSSGDGYMRIYPFGQAEPTATFINYSPYNPTNTGTITLCKSGCGSGDITAKGHGSATDVVMDVQGYFAKPMGGNIDDDGSVLQGSRISGVRHASDGVYYISFDRSVTGCSAVASPFFNSYDITAVQTTDDPGTASTALTILIVTKQRTDDTNKDTPFSVSVTC